MDLLFRVACHGGSDEPLNIHLRRLTDSAYTRKTLGGQDIDGESLAPVIQESHDGDCRREIMRHLRECLSEPNGKRWQRIYGGLALTEKLMEHGSTDLAIEVAHGHHFDLVQKVSFLEHFDAAARGCTDRRAQNMVRAKAAILLQTLVPQLQKASSEELPQNAGLNSGKDSASMCSKDTPGSTEAGSSSLGSSAVSDESPGASPVPPSPQLKPHIDEAFHELQTWMESVDYSSAESAPVSPRSSSDSDSDWEPIGPLPTKLKSSGPRQRADSSDSGDAFFTPMPMPASPAPSRGKQTMSL